MRWPADKLRRPTAQEQSNTAKKRLLRREIILVPICILTITATALAWRRPHVESSSGALSGTSRSFSSSFGNRRKLLSASECTQHEQPGNDTTKPWDYYCEKFQYPPRYDTIVGCGWLTCQTLQSGGVLLLFVGILYMFLGLAIVCDEFFVPALEVMVDRWNIDDDVAGATFMAAGGSAPELFTSLMSVFVAPSSASDTGFGTIVGSAVFNVLFVIGMCAMFSKGVLQLTWWPLFRDSCYYTVGLLVLAFFFLYGSSNPKKDQPYSMEWYESLVLLGLYLGYVVLMAFNTKLQKAIKRCLGSRKTRQSSSSTKVSPGKNAGSGSGQRKIVRRDSSRSSLLEELQRRNTMEQKTNFKSPLHFRAGVLHLMVSEKSILETAGIHVVTKIAGDIRQTFDHLAPSGELSRDDLAKLLITAGVGKDRVTHEIAAAFNKLDKDRNGSICWNEFQKWYAASEAKIWADCETIFKKIDVDGDQRISRSELITLLSQILGHEPSGEQISDAWLELLALHNEAGEGQQGSVDVDDDNNVTISKGLFQQWFQESIFFEDRQNAASVAEAEENSCLPPFPHRNPRAILFYLFSLPLVLPLYLTTPDVTKTKWQKFFVVTFFMSIVWIAVFSYVMVWLATVIGWTLGIPAVVMGITVLAAGTSVPDLLSSVIVAQQGKGDMAVSSSIGSNIFDILIGLPFPWILNSIIRHVRGETYVGNPVLAESMAFNILMLVGMLVAVIITIAASKWRMTKTLGFMMFVLYIIFLASALLASYWPQIQG